MVIIQRPNKIMGKAIDQTDIPVDNDALTFVAASDKWEAVAGGGGGGQSNTTSNSGAGEGLALPKVGVDLPFKSLTVTAPLTISSSATEIDVNMDSTGTGDVVRAISPTLVTPDVGTVQAGIWEGTAIAYANLALTGSIIGSDISTSAAIALVKLAAVTDGEILVGNVSNEVSSSIMSGDATFASSGILTIADNAITLAKMAGGTDGNLITYDASGNPAFVATGDDNQVLTSNGAGAPPTFQGGGGGGPTLIAKGTDEIVNNSSTLQNDDVLLFAASANTTYLVKFNIIFASATAADFKVRVTGPTGATGVYGDNHNSTSDLGSADEDENGTGVAQKRCVIYLAWVNIAGTAGNVTLQWAQRTANVSDTTIFAETIMEFQAV